MGKMEPFTMSELGVFLGVVGGILTSILLTIPPVSTWSRERAPVGTFVGSRRLVTYSRWLFRAWRNDEQVLLVAVLASQLVTSYTLCPYP